MDQKCGSDPQSTEPGCQKQHQSQKLRSVDQQYGVPVSEQKIAEESRQNQQDLQKNRDQIYRFSLCFQAEPLQAKSESRNKNAKCYAQKETSIIKPCSFQSCIQYRCSR